MKERHLFKTFVPENAIRLILGSFPGKESTKQQKEDDWFYCAPKN